MKHLELVTQFSNIGRTHRWDLLHNLLAEDFYFESGLNRVVGAQDFIEFERGRALASTFETLHLIESTDKCEYYHIYKTILFEPVLFDCICHEIIGVKNQFIQYSIVSANWEEIPEVIRDKVRRKP